MKRRATQIVRQCVPYRLGALPLTCPAEQLEIVFVDHADARGADGMPEAFEPAVDLTGQFAIRIEFPVKVGQVGEAATVADSGVVRPLRSAGFG